MKKRDRANESSSRAVKCFYCSHRCSWKDMQSHCDNHHNGKTRRLPGTQEITSFFNQPKKKRKIQSHCSAPNKEEVESEKPENENPPSVT